MTAPAGSCEWCGGPQNWTFMHGEMYVRCQLGCLPLELPGLTPPVSECPEETPKLSEMEPEQGRSVEPYEGGDAKTSGNQRCETGGLPF